MLYMVFDTFQSGFYGVHSTETNDVSRAALEWFTSYLSEQCFSVVVSKYSSSSTSLTYGVPQGSVLGRLLFLLYLLPLQHILSTFKDISYLCYADDIWLYISFKSKILQILNRCLFSIKHWMLITFSNLIKRNIYLR